ncbi:hypothetical protein OsJ_24745 [Oryza sativa Japonica Group]|uniref:Uncharacterized protein n=2 Tax=Oryza TaxID=4527 RepID=B9FXX6_ORYSJ|nr:hypothetical protein OsJ_24745 [Oryza sativa Japonica Group]
MAKNRNKKSKKCGGGGVAAMDTSEGAPAASTAVGAPEPMDTSEGKQTSSVSVALTSINKKTEDIPVLKRLDPKQTAQFFVSRKIKKGVQIKRSQNVRKMKAVARAISKNEKAEEKVLKAKSKKSRVQSAKSLYD